MDSNSVLFKLYMLLQEPEQEHAAHALGDADKAFVAEIGSHIFAKTLLPHGDSHQEEIGSQIGQVGIAHLQALLECISSLP